MCKEIHFDEKALGNKGIKDKSLIKLLKWPAIRGSGVPTLLSQENPNELCDRIKLFLLEKQVGKYSNIFNEKVIAIADKVLEYNCILIEHSIIFYYLNV